MTFINLAPILTFSLLFSFSYSSATTLATVGKNKITLEEFKEKYELAKEKTFVNVPTKEEFLQELIRYEMGLQEARRLNYQDDEKLQERINQLLYQYLLEKQLSDEISKIKVTESEMKSYYRTNPELRTAHILIEVPPGADKKQRAAAKGRALEIYKEVKASKKPFEELVTMYTDDSTTKRTGGDVGWQTRLTVTPNYYKAALSLKEGEIGGLVETLYGFHIIKLTGKKPYKKANKRQLRQIVFEIKRKNIFDQYFAKIKKRYPVKVNQKAL